MESAQRKTEPLIISKSELIELCSIDPELFENEFFPQAARQAPAPMHKEVWKLLDSSARQVNIQMFRGSAKTTKLRIYTAKRIAYGISRTILYIGLSQDKAVQSLVWLQRAIEHNRKFAETFQLSKGSKWTDTEIKIDCGLSGHTATILAYGVTGSVRGVNIDDYRPDLIVLDDIQNEQNAGTEEQREKLKNLVYGALLASLAPKTESPDAKMVMLQTPLNKEDVSTQALKDPGWVSARFSCWTPETENAADELKVSAWPTRFPSEDLRAEKRSYLARNSAFTWYREFECKITSPEESAFKPEWIRYYNTTPAREDLHIIAAIDPAPPPTEAQLEKGLRGKDYECLAVVGLSADNKFYLLDYVTSREHEPNWTISEFFRLSLKWFPATWVVETIGYQKTLELLLRDAMRKRGIYFPIMELRDKRAKYSRILDSLAGPFSNGAFYVAESHTDFVNQFVDYPNVTHDDILDAVGMCMLNMPVFQQGMQMGNKAGNVYNINSGRKLKFAYAAP